LRGGSDAYYTSAKIVEVIKIALKKVGVNENAVNMVCDTSRESVVALMTAVGKVDALIPRGGAGLIRSCVENAKVPCIQTGTGICHIYVDKAADFSMALDILENAKTSRPSVCNAAEVCLVHKEIAQEFLPLLKETLCEKRIAKGKNPVELRLCEEALNVIDGKKATEEDFNTEFLDYILAVKVVDGVKDAIGRIATHSTGHSEAIITQNKSVAEEFLNGVDSAAVYWNASTRFTDGGEFGKGCEIGISTQKLHARGPMGLEELTSYKYVIYGNGQIR
jgi:glutamate-5-semialdehyde dehydrogenase